MKPSILTILFTITGSLGWAQTLPEPQTQYSIIVYNSAACAHFSRACVENLKNKTIQDAQVATLNFCSDRFKNNSRVLNSNADCNDFMVEDITPPIPQPPQPPDMPNKFMCRAQVDFICE